MASYSNNSCTCSIPVDVLPEDKVQYLNEKEQLDVDIENRFRTLVTTIESELHKERNLLSEQKQKIVALRAAISQQRREETVRPDKQWPEIFKLTRLIDTGNDLFGAANSGQETSSGTEFNGRQRQSTAVLCHRKEAGRE